jgi:hypothetical protein
MPLLVTAENLSISSKISPLINLKNLSQKNHFKTLYPQKFSPKAKFQETPGPNKKRISNHANNK